MEEREVLPGIFLTDCRSKVGCFMDRGDHEYNMQATKDAQAALLEVKFVKYWWLHSCFRKKCKMMLR